MWRDVSFARSLALYITRRRRITRPSTGGSPRAIRFLSNQALDHDIARTGRSLRIPSSRINRQLAPGRRTDVDASSHPRFRVEAAKKNASRPPGDESVPLVVPREPGSRDLSESGEGYGVSEFCAGNRGRKRTVNFFFFFRKEEKRKT